MTRRTGAERPALAARLVHDPDCELCIAHKMSEWFHEDDECWVAECIMCATPMIVWRPHGMPDETTEKRLLDVFARVADGHYGDKGWWLDPNRRNIPDHWHAHARPAGGFFGHR